MWKWWACRRLRGRLVDVVAGVLPPAQRTRLELHLVSCTGCRDALGALREVSGLLGSREPAGLDEDFWHDQRQAIMQTVRDLPPPAGARRWRHALDPVSRRPWATWAPVVAAATAMLAVVTLRLEMPCWSPVVGTAEVDGLDDPALLSLSDLAGDTVGTPGLGVEVASSEQPLPELSDDELDALSQLVGGDRR